MKTKKKYKSSFRNSRLIKRSSFFLGIVFSISLFSCKKQSTNSIDYGFDHYPIKQGNNWVYEVEEINHDVTSDTLFYLLKEEIGGVYIDGLGRENRMIYRYTKAHDTLPWTSINTWYVYQDSTRIERTEEDKRIISLIFPIREGKSWIGNELNDLDKWSWVYDKVNEPVTVLSSYYLNTATVLQRDNYNLVEYEKASEVYAEGVGLVEKVFIDLDINNFDPTDINRGVEYRKRLREYTVN